MAKLGHSDGGISVSGQVNFLWNDSDVRMVIELILYFPRGLYSENKFLVSPLLNKCCKISHSHVALIVNVLLVSSCNM